jgi:hypothetical protein
MESKEHLKQKFAALTDTDVLFLEGKEEMITKLQVSVVKQTEIQNY